VSDRTPRQDARAPSERRRDVGVLIVDHQPFFRGAARQLLAAMPGFCAVADASSGSEAVEAVDELRPDLVLLDVRMPGMNGIETARRIKARRPETVVVLISIEDVGGVPSTARSCGAAAVIRKQDLAPSLLRGLWALHGPAPA
jgi:two-component system, NarL family, invasion response regulator UvrY